MFFCLLSTNQEEFLSLCVDKLTEILSSDFLNVPKEEMVFEAATLWLNKCPSRKQSFEKVRVTHLKTILEPVHTCLSIMRWYGVLAETAKKLQHIAVYNIAIPNISQYLDNIVS